MIPYIDLVSHHAALRAEILEAVGRVLDHGQFVLGPEVAAFEAEIARRLDVRHVIAVGTGTDALVLALRARGVGPGDEVITVSHSFVATATAVRLVGATPVLVDVDDATMTMDPLALEHAVTARTKAVIPVHLGGWPCDLTAIQDVCNRHDLHLIEDCAQSVGARHRGRSVGTYGVGCFSLHPLKVLSALGDGGFLTTHSDEEAALFRKLRNNGLRDRDHVQLVSPNSRLDTVQAAALLVKLKYLDGWVAQRRAHADAYREALGAVVRVLPPEHPRDLCVYSTFVIRHPQRDRLAEALRRRGVDVKVHYPVPIHRQEAYATLPCAPLPVTERVVAEILSLPVTPELSVAGREQVIEAVRSAAEEVG